MTVRRLVVVVGTRPEAIKIAPVVVAARCHHGVEPVVVATGQHHELVDRALEPFGIRVDRRLDLGERRSTSQAELVALLLPRLEAVLADLQPDAVLVQGDTASAMAGALVAVWQRIPVVHLEAGLRSFDVANPFPEETYRRLIADLADLHLSPTPRATANLLAEGVPAHDIVQVGNTVVDAALHAADLGRGSAPGIGPDRRLVLVTVHRRENWGEPLADVLAAVRQLIDRFADIEVVVPAHPNPLVRGPVEAAAVGCPRLHVVEPMDHPDLIADIRAATLVLTDSGGIQEEAPAFGTPVLVLRTTTERPEAVEAGCAELVGTEVAAIVARAGALLGDEDQRQLMATVVNPFGDGRSGRRTVEAVAWRLGLGDRPADWGAPQGDRPATSEPVDA